MVLSNGKPAALKCRAEPPISRCQKSMLFDTWKYRKCFLCLFLGEGRGRASQRKIEDFWECYHIHISIGFDEQKGYIFLISHWYAQYMAMFGDIGHESWGKWLFWAKTSNFINLRHSFSHFPPPLQIFFWWHLIEDTNM